MDYFRKSHFPLGVGSGVYQADDLTSTKQEIPDCLFKITLLREAETEIRLSIVLFCLHELSIVISF